QVQGAVAEGIAVTRTAPARGTGFLAAVRALIERAIPGRWAMAPAFAATVALIAVGGALVHLSLESRESAPIMRSTGQDEPELQAPLADGRALPREHFRLAWSGLAGARYELMVTTAAPSLQVLTRRTGLAESEWIVPEQMLQGLEDGDSVLWVVVATLPDG